MSLHAYARPGREPCGPAQEPHASGPQGADDALARIRADRGRVRRRTSGLVLVLLICIAAAAGIGPVPISPRVVLEVLGHHLLAVPAQLDVPETVEQIVWTTRAPRVAMGAVAGAALGVAGAVLQALVRNVLADPYIVGVNAGASTGAAVVILVIGSGSALMLSGAALAGAVGATALVLAVAGAAGQRGPNRIVLAGMAVGYALNAVTSFLIFFSGSPEAARSVMFWLLGSLAMVQPQALVAAAVATGIGLTVLLAVAPLIDALASGDDSARSTGIDPERARFAVMAGVSAMVGVVIAGVGGVGFVGLVVPHLARRLVGGRHRAVLPVAALLGAAVLVTADTIARTALAPLELPVGVVTGVIGAPFLLFLLRGSGTPHRRG
ncbi:MAG: iron ABC transporter permease [Cellulomonas sp.]|nr:iron ABC transporter permease [Cellulomonas sp.]